jgi:hypothetical protein
LTNGSKIDTSAALSSFNKKQFHHIYPRAFLKRSTSRTDDNLLINICILAAAANNAVSDSDPNVYLPATAEHLKSECDAVFSSNILPKPSEFNYSTASYEDFLGARVILIGEVINKLCSGAVLDNAGSLFSSAQA